METCRKYNLSPDIAIPLEAEISGQGAEGLKPAISRVESRVRALEEENERLKRIHR